jgi:hypothetical protein
VLVSGSGQPRDPQADPQDNSTSLTSLIVGRFVSLCFPEIQVVHVSSTGGMFRWGSRHATQPVTALHGVSRFRLARPPGMTTTSHSSSTACCPSSSSSANQSSRCTVRAGASHRAAVAVGLWRRVHTGPSC